MPRDELRRSLADDVFQAALADFLFAHRERRRAPGAAPFGRSSKRPILTRAWMRR